jgi:hypothetical protein
MPGLLSRVGKSRKWDLPKISMFHVKQGASSSESDVSRETVIIIEMNQEVLLTYTKFSEDNIENMLDIDPAEQPSERLCRRAQILRDEFLTLARLGYTAMQQIRRLSQ